MHLHLSTAHPTLSDQMSVSPEIKIQLSHPPPPHPHWPSPPQTSTHMLSEELEELRGGRGCDVQVMCECFSKCHWNGQPLLHNPLVTSWNVNTCEVEFLINTHRPTPTHQLCLFVTPCTRVYQGPGEGLVSPAVQPPALAHSVGTHPCDLQARR